MVIWLRQGTTSVGIEGAVLRKEDFAQVSSLDQAMLALEEERERTLAQARMEAELILEDAQVRADDLLSRAQFTFDNSARDGYAAGHQKGLDDWHAAAAQGMVDTRLALYRMREKMAQLVIQAVEQVVSLEDRSGLFKRVGALLERLIADSTFMTIKVNSLELDLAKADFQAIAETMGWKLPIKVVGSDDLEVGSCQCEWDYGTLDASIPKQLSAIRRAVQHALEKSDFVFQNTTQAASSNETSLAHDDESYEESPDFESMTEEN